MNILIRKPLSFSEIGKKDMQEDSIYPSAHELSATGKVFILCDGMGGHENGEVASATVCQAMGGYFSANSDNSNETELFQGALSHAYDELDKVDTGGPKKMGTTMTCLYLNAKGALVAHIGDSRIYHIRPSYVDIENKRLGILYQSSDHSLVNDLVKAGELTEEEARNFPQKNIITRAMQPNLERRPKADIMLLTDVKPGDYFFMCCDGVLEQLTNEKLSGILAEKSTSDEEKLQSIKSVCDNQTKDNYTCLLIPIDYVEQNESVVAKADSATLVADAELVTSNIGIDKKNASATVTTARCKMHKKSSVKMSCKAVAVAVIVIAVIIISVIYIVKEQKLLPYL